MTIKRNPYVLLYFILSVALITTGFWTSKVPSQPILVTPLSLSDMFFIFLYNFTFMTFLLIISCSGLSIIYMIKFLVSMGQSAKESGINPLVYYTASFPHGILEVLLSLIIVIYSVKHIHLLWNFFFNNLNSKEMGEFYKNSFLKLIPLVGLLCFLGAVLEVYVSNPIIRYLIT